MDSCYAHSGTVGSSFRTKCGIFRACAAISGLLFPRIDFGDLVAGAAFVFAEGYVQEDGPPDGWG